MSQFIPQNIKTFFKNRLKESVGTFLLLFFIFTIVSYYTYTPEDSSLNTAGLSVKNKMGVLGAIYADVILQVIGFSAYLISPILFIWGIRSLKTKKVFSANYRLFPMLISIILFSFIFSGFHSNSITAGGILGNYLWENINNTLSNVYSGIILYFSSFVALFSYIYSLNLKNKLIKNILLKTLFLIVQIITITVKYSYLVTYYLLRKIFIKTKISTKNIVNKITNYKEIYGGKIKFNKNSNLNHQNQMYQNLGNSLNNNNTNNQQTNMAHPYIPTQYKYYTSNKNDPNNINNKPVYQNETNQNAYNQNLNDFPVTTNNQVNNYQTNNSPNYSNVEQNSNNNFNNKNFAQRQNYNNFTTNPYYNRNLVNNQNIPPQQRSLQGYNPLQNQNYNKQTQENLNSVPEQNQNYNNYGQNFSPLKVPDNQNNYSNKNYPNNKPTNIPNQNLVNENQLNNSKLNSASSINQKYYPSNNYPNSNYPRNLQNTESENIQNTNNFPLNSNPENQNFVPQNNLNNIPNQNHNTHNFNNNISNDPRNIPNQNHASFNQNSKPTGMRMSSLKDGFNNFIANIQPKDNNFGNKRAINVNTDYNNPANNTVNITPNIQNNIVPNNNITPVSSGYKNQIYINKPSNFYKEFILPKSEFLNVYQPSQVISISEQEQAEKVSVLEDILQTYKVSGEVMAVKLGPVVTTYEFEPAPGTKSSAVINLADDIARSIGALSVRISHIPGRTVLGIELPNKKRAPISFRELVESEIFVNTDMKLPLVIGKDIEGNVNIADLAKMPHILIAGTTGSGKSVGVNGMIMSLLYKFTPKQLRLIMIDPKIIEFAAYESIPHLLTPIVTEPEKAIASLKWAVREMNSRYNKMAVIKAKNIESYNNKIQESLLRQSPITQTIKDVKFINGRKVEEEKTVMLEAMPFIVIIVDEFAELMLTAGKEIDSSIQSIAQKARAAGIHLIMATQRPSADVVTGTIKANFPARISYTLASAIDSRTIIGANGAEKLLGNGDLLILSSGSKAIRAHSAYVSESEIEKICDHLRSQGNPDYIDNVTEEPIAEEDHATEQTNDDGDDNMYTRAVQLVTREQKASTSFIQRSLKIGYNRAATIMEEMEKNGIVSKASATGKRDVLMGG